MINKIKCKGLKTDEAGLEVALRVVGSVGDPATAIKALARDLVTWTGKGLETWEAPDLDLEALVPEVQYLMVQAHNFDKMVLVLGSGDRAPTADLEGQDLGI